MSVWVVEKTDNYLAHHGIQGQKWGKRNGPPYPLPDAPSAKAKKAGTKRKTVSEGIADYRKKRLEKLKAKNAKIAARNKQIEAIKKEKEKNRELKEKRKELKAKPKSEESLKDLKSENVSREYANERLKDSNVTQVKPETQSKTNDKHKKVKDMTDDEIRERIERARLEKTYKDITKTGADEVKEILADNGKQALKEITKQVMIGGGKAAIKAIIAKHLGDDAAQEVMGGIDKTQRALEKQRLALQAQQQKDTKANNDAQRELDWAKFNAQSENEAYNRQQSVKQQKDIEKIRKELDKLSGEELTKYLDTNTAKEKYIDEYLKLEKKKKKD